MPEDTPEDSGDNNDYSTKSNRVRWEWLNTILSIILVFSLPGFLAYALYTGTALAVITQPWFLLYSVVILMAATWAFGKETLEAVRKAQDK